MFMVKRYNTYIRLEISEEILKKAKEWEKLYEIAKDKGHKDKFIDGQEIRANRIGKEGEPSSDNLRWQEILPQILHLLLQPKQSFTRA